MKLYHKGHYLEPSLDKAQRQFVISAIDRDEAALAKRRAAEPLKAKAPQNFDCSPLPLFGDSKNQQELF